MEEGEATIERFSKLLEAASLVEFDIAILRGPDEQGDPFVVEQGVLGLHAGDLAWLARDCRTVYRKVRKDITTTAGKQELLRVSSCLLLVCPDHATAWADRKRALLSLAKDTTRN